MRDSFLLGCLVCVASAAAAYGQQPTLRITGDAPAVVTAEPVIPAERLTFEQDRHDYYQSPKSAIRANAEARAAQRRGRIAALKWYGLSKSRPIANPTPFTGPYSPGWVGSVQSPFQWTGGSGAVILKAENGTLKRY